MALNNGLTSVQLIKEIVKDVKNDMIGRKGILKVPLPGFYNWLINEVPRQIVKEKSLILKIAHIFVSTISKFYTIYDIMAKFKGREQIHNQFKHYKYELTGEDVKRQ